MRFDNSLRKSKRYDTVMTAILFLLPTFFLLSIYVYYSSGYSFYLSLFNWDGVKTFKEYSGLQNWFNLAKDVKFYLAFLNNIKIVVLSIVVQLPFGLVLAFLLYMGGKRYNFFKVMYFLPNLMSIVAIGFLFIYIYDPYFGIISVATKFLGLGQIDFLGSEKRALYAVIAVICWQVIPFYMIYFMSSLSSISNEIYDAALIDGANSLQLFFFIAIPMLKNYITNALVLIIVGSLKYFDLIYVMTEGGPGGSSELMATYMYKFAFHNMRMSYGATIASAMLIIITIVSLIILSLRRRTVVND